MDRSLLNARPCVWLTPFREIVAALEHQRIFAPLGFTEQTFLVVCLHDCHFDQTLNASPHLHLEIARGDGVGETENIYRQVSNVEAAVTLHDAT